MNWLTRTEKQDRHIDSFKGHSRASASIQDVGATGATDGNSPRFVTVRYAQAKEQPKSVRNLNKSNKQQRILAETEKVYETNVYPIQRFSRKFRKNQAK